MASFLNNAANIYFLNDTQVVLNPYSELTAPPIVTDGLIIYMDATNTASYPGSGSSIFNLVAGQTYTGSLVNGPTYSGGYIQLNSDPLVKSYININAPNYTNTSCTVMGATRYTDTSGNGRMIAGTNNNWLLGSWSNTMDNYFCEGTVYGIPGSISADTNWRIYTGTCNLPGDSYGFYINGTSIATNANGSQGPNGLRIGGASNDTEYSDGQFAFIMLYNRVLTQSEITQNYDALKSKVGLT